MKKNGARNILLLPNPGWITGPIFPLSLSTRIRFVRLYTPQIRSREFTVRYEKSLSLKELSAPNNINKIDVFDHKVYL